MTKTLTDHGFFITWNGPIPKDEDVSFLVKDLLSVLEEGLDKPKDLIFHTSTLTDDYDGPSIWVVGGNEDNEFVAEYSATTEWVTRDLDDDAVAKNVTGIEKVIFPKKMEGDDDNE